MLPIRTLVVAALALTAVPALAAPVAPEPAPPAQRAAPPDKIAPPMKVPTKPETTGQAPKELEPGKGQNVQIPSSPNEANTTKCGDASQQEQTLRSTRCP